MAIELLRDLSVRGPRDLADEVLVLSGRFAQLKKRVRRGILGPPEAEVERNEIAIAIPQVLDELVGKLAPASAPVVSPVVSPSVFAGTEAVAFEKILGVNNLKQIAWIEQGVKSSRAVCRVLTPEGLGTGFLIAPQWVMTNNHVIDSPELAKSAKIEFNYQYQFAVDGKLADTVRYDLDPASFFRTSTQFDYTIVAVKPDPAKPPADTWGTLHLNPNADPVSTEHVVIVQHPNGGPKQIVLTANAVLQVKPPHLHYSTYTMPGSSGSPVFNDLWQVIAIHHAAGPQIKSSSGTRYSNEGVLMSAIKPELGKDWPF